MRPAKTKLAPGERIRALVVDDSVIIRRLVTHALGEDPQVEVVGSAANGAIALKMIPLVRPHVVTLDIEMPEMDGLETLRNIRKLYPELIVIMFSTLSERGAAVTLEALTLGANDYVTKVGELRFARSINGAPSRRTCPEIQTILFAWRGACAPAGSAQSADNGATGAPRTNVFKPRIPCQAVAIGVLDRRAAGVSYIDADDPSGFSPTHFHRAAYASGVHASPGRTLADVNKTARARSC